MNTAPAPTLEELEYDRIIRHEAGHWLVAKLLGFNAIGIHIHDKGGHCSVSLNVATSDMDAIRSYLKNRCKQLYAGYLAERIRDGRFDEELYPNMTWDLFGSYCLDYAQFRELVTSLGNISDQEPNDELRAEIGDQLKIETIGLLRQHSATLEAIVKYLKSIGPKITCPSEDIEALPEVRKALALS